MPLHAIESQRLYQKVADQIASLIRRGEFAPGHRLPPERDLARLMGVSRPVIREAMIALEVEGLVGVRTGSGTYVRDPRVIEEADVRTVVLTGDFDPVDLIASRRIVEAQTAYLAAAKASAADLEGIEEAVTMLREANAEGRNGQSADRLFHVRIAASTGNSVLASVVDGLWSNMFAPAFDQFSSYTFTAENQAVTLRDHIRILEALKQRDPEVARQEMQSHLVQVESVLQVVDRVI